MMRAPRPTRLLVLLLGGACTALGAQRPATTILTWPAPPEPPRIRYVGSLSSERDIGRTESFLSKLRAALAGGRRQSVIAIERPFDAHVVDGRRFYVTNGALRAVLVFDRDRKQARALGVDVPGGLLKPMGLGGDAHGTVFVADAGLRRVVAFAPDGSFRRVIGGPSLLLNPVDVAADPSGEWVYVVDSYLHQVLVFDSSGTLRTRIGRDAGSLLAAERRRASSQVHGDVRAIRADGSEPPPPTDSSTAAAHAGFDDVGASDVWENRSAAPAEFRYPVAVAVGPDGAIYVSDQMNFRVQVFEPDGRFRRTFGRLGDTPGSLARPKGLSVDREGRVYVADAAFNNVQVFDSTGALLIAFGWLGHGEGEFWLPMGLTIDGHDRIYVADRYNNRIEVYELLANPTGDSGADAPAAAPRRKP